ncbi:MAG: hypothetical protein VCB42_09700 [Myxococcota bacterium]
MTVSRISRSAAAVVAVVAMALIPPAATGQVQTEPAATDSGLEEQAPRPEGPAEPSAEASAPEAAASGDPPETPGPAAAPAGAATKAFDVIVTRPLGLCSLVLGFTFFSITAPFVAATPGTDIPASWDLFVLSRWDYTFVRPLGEL